MREIAYVFVLGCTCLLVWGVFHLLDLLVNWLVSKVWLVLEKRHLSRRRD
ncbi:hypothetical protein [Enterococcus sp. 5B3_DIV0040]|nr:hypothetical protein [Enterococcus sp. 5B3_DIV0040]OTO05127.1 hypothetical protein A5883_002117 [Enterococcus sp. 5B3_DIV0040]